MNTPRQLASLILTGGLVMVTAHAQTYVTPRLGGSQTAADMVHIDISYDAAANQLNARVDDTYGLPQLRPLEPGFAFDPQAAFAVLTGKAYNAQYGWNAGGYFSIPPGAAIWIEPIDSSPGLEVYEGWGKSGSYTPILGTADSPRLWRWSGVMVHNTYAVLEPITDRFFAEYRIYFGDAGTGSREGFLDLDDAQVRLEWTAVPVEESFRFGAVAETPGSPLLFVNAGGFVTESEFVVSLHSTNAGPFETTLPMLAVPATSANGGPVPHHAALGACLEFQLVSLCGPPAGHLSVWETNASSPLFAVDTGERAGTHRFPVSQNRAVAGTDPYGRCTGLRFTVDRPGFYTLGFRLVDSSTSGPAGSPLHVASEVYHVYLQAGVTVAWTEWQDSSLTATFGGLSGRVFHLERSPALGPAARWQTVAGPLPGTNRLQRLIDPAAAEHQGFYRLRGDPR